MTIEQTVPKRTNRRASAKRGGDPLSEGWTRIGTYGDLARQNVSPTAAYLDQLYVYGGDDANAVPVSTNQGVAWTTQTGDWTPPRDRPAGTVFGGQLWLVGGVGCYDTWTKAPGQKWYPVDRRGDWGPRWGHALTGFRNDLYLLGGVQNQTLMGDVWVWNKATSRWDSFHKSAFGERRMMAAGVVEDSLLLMGGTVGQAPLAEVLVSKDAYSYIQQKVPWPARHTAVAANLGDTVYLIGGQGNDGPLTDVWRSVELGAWFRVSTTAPRFSKVGAAAVDDHIVVAGGGVGVTDNPDVWAFMPPPWGWSQVGRPLLWGLLRPNVGRVGQTWYAWGEASVRVDQSPDGVNWDPLSNNLPERYEAAGVAHNGKLFYSGGLDAQSHPYNDVYCSTDGANWVRQTESAEWPARYGHAMASFNGELWVLAGQGFGDVWSSDNDGVTWRPRKLAAFPGRAGARAIVFKNRLYLLGGDDQGHSFKEVWSTADGESWKSATPEWPARFQAAATVLGDEMYLLGGMGNGRDPWADVWATFDGESWRPLETSTPFTTFGEFCAFTVGDQIIALGGASSGRMNQTVYRYLPRS